MVAFVRAAGIALNIVCVKFVLVLCFFCFARKSARNDAAFDRCGFYRAGTCLRATFNDALFSRWHHEELACAFCVSLRSVVLTVFSLVFLLCVGFTNRTCIEIWDRQAAALSATAGDVQEYGRCRLWQIAPPARRQWNVFLAT